MVTGIKLISPYIHSLVRYKHFRSALLPTTAVFQIPREMLTHTCLCVWLISLGVTGFTFTRVVTKGRTSFFIFKY